MSVSVQDPVDTVDRGDLLHSSHSCAGFSLQRVIELETKVRNHGEGPY